MTVIGKGMRVSTRERGYSTKYAPITPAMAPEAPTIGTSESGAAAVCASAAPTPLSR
jgi:hypothetical protein